MKLFYFIINKYNLYFLLLYRLIDQYATQPEILDINCVDPLNRSALIAAIENENIELIKLLLKAGIKVKVSLFMFQYFYVVLD